jgi:hypothetical protein
MYVYCCIFDTQMPFGISPSHLRYHNHYSDDHHHHHHRRHDQRRALLKVLRGLSFHGLLPRCWLHMCLGKLFMK